MLFLCAAQRGKWPNGRRIRGKSPIERGMDRETKAKELYISVDGASACARDYKTLKDV